MKIEQGEGWSDSHIDKLAYFTESIQENLERLSLKYILSENFVENMLKKSDHVGSTLQFKSREEALEAAKNFLHTEVVPAVEFFDMCRTLATNLDQVAAHIDSEEVIERTDTQEERENLIALKIETEILSNKYRALLENFEN